MKVKMEEEWKERRRNISGIGEAFGEAREKER